MQDSQLDANAKGDGPRIKAGCIVHAIVQLITKIYTKLPIQYRCYNITSHSNQINDDQVGFQHHQQPLSTVVHEPCNFISSLWQYKNVYLFITRKYYKFKTAIVCKNKHILQICIIIQLNKTLLILKQYSGNGCFNELLFPVM